MLHANIHEVSIGEHDQPKIHFSLHDGEDTAQVSFLDTMGLAHATFLVEHSLIEPGSAYYDMVYAFVNAEDADSLVGTEYTSED